MEENKKIKIKGLESDLEKLRKAKKNVDKKIEQKESDIKKYRMERSVRGWFHRFLRKTFHMFPETERTQLLQTIDNLQEQNRILSQQYMEETRRLKRELSKATQAKKDYKEMEDNWKKIKKKYEAYEKMAKEGKIQGMEKPKPSKPS